jgi:hypothetical protein
LTSSTKALRPVSISRAFLGRRDRKLAHLGLEVGEQGAVRPAIERRTLGDVAAVVDDVRIDPLRRQHALGLAILGLGDCLVENRIHALQPAHIGLRIREVVDPVDVDQESGPLALGAVHLIEDVTIVAEGEEAAAALHHILEQIVAELVLGRERRPVERERRLASVVTSRLRLASAASSVNSPQRP